MEDRLNKTEAFAEPVKEPTVPERAENVDYWASVVKASEQAAPLADDRFTKDPDEHFRYEAKPVHVIAIFGSLAAILLVGQFFVPYQLLQVGKTDYTGFLRLAMIILGSYFVFAAWPRHRDTRISAEEEQATEEMRERFARIRYGK
ncbi:MAG: hypothetical protein M3R04_00445 [bacterium]|nr:hypothetical protein [bacterium]